MNNRRKGFVAVHVGAGYHSPANSDLYRTVCRAACKKALEAIRQNKPAIVAVREAIMCLEDSPYTNAGTGSNLTINGQVECDASIMDGESLQFGAVGAVGGVKNPILVAESLVFTQLKGVMSLGRIPPSTLVGTGAFDWASRHGIQTTTPNGLITESSRRAFIKHKRKLDLLEQDLASEKIKLRKLDDNRGDAPIDGQCDNLRNSALGTSSSSLLSGTAVPPHSAATSTVTINGASASKPISSGASTSKPTASCASTSKPTPSGASTSKPISSGASTSKASASGASCGPNLCSGHDELLDTVGAVCIDEHGHIASAVSSGGIVLKQPGRLGQAALYGCGCWAENYGNGKSVGVSTSGCGEQLSKTLLARECAYCLKKHDNALDGLVEVFHDKFLRSYLLKNIDQKLGGALAVRTQQMEDGLEVELLWGHTTDSMCLGYMSAGDAEASAFISRLPEGKPCGRTYIVQSKLLRL